MKTKEYFPLLTDHNHQLTSPQTDEYNCIAWAFNDSTKWWEPAPGYYWPPNATRSYDLNYLIAWLESEGYVKTTETSYSKKKIRIGIYKIGTDYSHISRQVGQKKWASKLGGLEDIIHESLEILEGDIYGCIACMMEKKLL